jgi:hypothetical protein
VRIVAGRDNPSQGVFFYVCLTRGEGNLDKPLTGWRRNILVELDSKNIQNLTSMTVTIGGKAHEELPKRDEFEDWLQAVERALQAPSHQPFELHAVVEETR